MELRQQFAHARCPHLHTSYPGTQHYKDTQRLSPMSSRSSDDPYTDKLPPKARRRSSEQNKTSTRQEKVSTEDS